MFIEEEDPCSLPSAIGGANRECRAAFTKWYHNSETKQCETVSYGRQLIFFQIVTNCLFYSSSMAAVMATTINSKLKKNVKHVASKKHK